MSKVSVVVNCYDGEKHLREALDSIYAQTYTNWEIVFVDNASKDKTSDIAKSYGDKLKYIQNKKNVPLGEARNIALENCDGKYIAFLDADDIWLPRKLEKQIELLEGNKKLGFVFSDTYFFNGHGDERRMYEDGDYPATGNVFSEMFRHYNISLETVVLRDEALKNLDEPFDNKFQFAEEAELFLRIAYEWEIGMIQEPLSKWRVNPESLTWTRKDLEPLENQMILDKFIDKYPNFEEHFSDEVHCMRKAIAKQWALIAWQKRNKQETRTQLSKYIFEDKLAFVLYFMSFLPFICFDKFYSSYTKGKGFVRPL